MTSIIKVDQIQTASGSSPTAGSLGFNESNAIIQQVLDTRTASIASSSTSYADAGYSITFTPKKANSKILVELKGGRPWMPNTSNQLDVSIVVDGDTSGISNNRIMSLYASGSAQVHLSVYAQKVFYNTGTAARTYTVQWRTGGSGTQYASSPNHAPTNVFRPYCLANLGICSLPSVQEKTRIHLV